MLNPKQPNMRGTPLERRYYKWLEGMPCALSARTDEVERAHLRKFTGMGIKPHPRHILPLHHTLHEAEHDSPKHFWPCVFDDDPRDWAERLFEMFEQNDRTGAELLLVDMHEKASQPFLRMVFERAA